MPAFLSEPGNLDPPLLRHCGRGPLGLVGCAVPVFAKAPIPALLASLGALCMGCGWLPEAWNGGLRIGPPPAAKAELAAVAVATLEAPVKARRGGRVLALRVRPGDVVSRGDALIELEDLALQESKAELRREIADLDAAQSGPAKSPGPGARERQRDFRTAALQQLREAHRLAGEEFEHWAELFREGLLARLDFEEKQREFKALGARVAEAAASQRAAAAEPSETTALRRARRLLERLRQLPETYAAESGCDGTVKELLVAVGDRPARGTVVATISRAALPKLEARIADTVTVVAIEEA
ncbi:MAG: biotin/lipoyl-binding protein [Bryobacterales bacterium]|nr:biotin/lipoyl-binding protein [Bryobacterales bacterium]